MVTTLTAHVKSGVFVPDSPIDLPEGQEVEVRIVGATDDTNGARHHNAVPRRSGANHFTSLDDLKAFLADERNLVVDEDERRRSHEELQKYIVSGGRGSDITNEEIDALLAEEYGSNHASDYELP